MPIFSFFLDLPHNRYENFDSGHSGSTDVNQTGLARVTLAWRRRKRPKKIIYMASNVDRLLATWIDFSRLANFRFLCLFRFRLFLDDWEGSFHLWLNSKKNSAHELLCVPSLFKLFVTNDMFSGLGITSTKVNETERVVLSKSENTRAVICFTP